MPDVEVASQVESAVAEKNVLDAERSPQPADGPPVPDARPEEKQAVEFNNVEGKVRRKEGRGIKAMVVKKNEPEDAVTPFKSAVAENTDEDSAGSEASSWTMIGLLGRDQYSASTVLFPCRTTRRYAMKKQRRDGTL